MSQNLFLFITFWDKARELAQQSKEIAACCNETLLIYFASDDPQNLLQQVTEQLGQ